MVRQEVSLEQFSTGIKMTRLLFLYGLVLALSSGQIYAEDCKNFVLDALDRSICVPPRVERIAITSYGGAAQEVLIFNGVNRLVAQPRLDRFPQLVRMYPHLQQLPDIGSFDNVNLESLLTVRPDMVFASYFAERTNGKIRSLGIPVFVLGTGRQNLKSILKEFENVGTLLGEKEKAHQLVVFWRERLAIIQNRIASASVVPKRVLYIGGSGGTDNRLGWGDAFITEAGGINVARDLEVKGVISAEQVRLWNPDVIITSNRTNSVGSAASIRSEGFYRQVKAVKDDEVYVVPVGGFWWDRPSPESILGILWLSKILYPELLDDINLEHESQEFFERFYGYKLPSDEFMQFF